MTAISANYRKYSYSKNSSATDKVAHFAFRFSFKNAKVW